MKIYKSFEQIEYDLKRLKLERQIGAEQLKGVKHEFSESLKPVNWIVTGAKFAGKYGVLILIKKFFRKF